MAIPTNTPSRVRLRRRLRKFWRDFHWLIIGLLAVAAFTLGFIGFLKNPPPDVPSGGAARTGWDTFYLTLQLFTMESGTVVTGNHTGWEIQVARLLAPLVAAYVVVQTILALLAEKVETFWFRFIKGHLVICGLGEKGLLLARSARSQGDRVAVIEKDANNSLIEQCKDEGAHVLIGDATDPRMLNKARARRAKHLIAICGDEGMNAEIAAQAAALMRDDQKAPFLNCHVKISDSGLWDMLREREVISGSAERFRLQYFNVFDSGARKILNQFLPLSESSGNRPHILILGLSHLGERILLQAAREWWQKWEQTGERLRVTLLDPAAGLKHESLGLKYPQLNKVCDISCESMRVTSPEFQKADFLFGSDGAAGVTSVFVCLEDDAQSLAAALSIFQHARRQKPAIVVCTSNEAGLAALLRDVNRNYGEYAFLHTFGLLNQTCDIDLLRDGINETLAQDIHRNYVESLKGDVTAATANPALVSWQDLPEAFKESNRRQADDIRNKFKAVFCGIAPMLDWAEQPIEFSRLEVEEMARLEHARWLKEKRAEGWTLGPRDHKKKTNPYMVEWDALSEQGKEPNRETVRALPQFLKRAGFKVYRLR